MGRHASSPARAVASGYSRPTGIRRRQPGHVGYPIDRLRILSATPSTASISVAGVGDRSLLGSEVAAAPEDQGFRVVAAGLHFPDPADDDLVVSPLKLVLHGAFEGGDDPVDAGAAGPAAAVPDPV